MPVTDANPAEDGRCTRPGAADLSQTEREILARVREVAQSITERVRKALDGTGIQLAAPAEPTEERPHS
jgi:hypothetical protein